MLQYVVGRLIKLGFQTVLLQCFIAHKSTNSIKPDLYLGLALRLGVHSPQWHSISSIYPQYIHVSSMHHQLTTRLVVRHAQDLFLANFRARTDGGQSGHAPPNWRARPNNDDDNEKWKQWQGVWGFMDTLSSLALPSLVLEPACTANDFYNAEVWRAQ